MSNDRPASGSRWEPPADRADPEPPGAPFDPEPLGRPADAGSGAPVAHRLRIGMRSRLRLVAAVAGLLLLGGAGGFWLGHTTAPSPTTGAAAGVGAHQHRDRGGDGDRYGPNGGAQAPGGDSVQAPGATSGTGA